MVWEKFIQAGIRMPFYMHLYVEGQRISMPELIGWSPERWLVVIEEQLATVYYDLQDQKRFGEFFMKDILRNDARRKQFLDVLTNTDMELLSFCRRLYHADYAGVDNVALHQWLQEFVRLFRNKFALYGLPKFIDGAVDSQLPNLLSKPLTPELYAKLVANHDMTDYSRERLALLLIARTVRDRELGGLFTKTNAEIIEQLGRFHPMLYHKIESYAREFAWVLVNHHVQPLNLDQSIAAVVATLKDELAMEELDRYLGAIIKTRDQEIAYLSQHAFTEEDKLIIKFFRSVSFINESRKASMSKAVLWSYGLFQEIANRLDIDIISLRQLTELEMLTAVERGAIDAHSRSIINDRLDTYTCVLRDGDVVMLSGVLAKEMIAKELVAPVAADEIKGVVASVGYAKGRARLILMEYQTEQLEDGEILVSSMTDPDMVPAMKKAAAIVTDEGGLTCHAAIVSRELGKPCVIATKIATKVFKNGDMLEVDAKNGVVRKINDANLAAG